MTDGYTQVGDTQEALTLFKEMRLQGLLTDEFTLASLLFVFSQE
jgi:pentatricopeptide repeat protein